VDQVDAVSAFAKATTLPAFFVSFVITPFASNASELVSSLTFAAKKKKKNISLTYSQVYGAVTMNNTMCFSVFMALVAFRYFKDKK
jgi:Ca2+/Na+ antiporter